MKLGLSILLGLDRHPHCWFRTINTFYLFRSCGDLCDLCDLGNEIAQHIFLDNRANFVRETLLYQNMQKSLRVPTISGFLMGLVKNSTGLLVQCNNWILNVNDTTEFPAYENFTSIILPFNLHLNDKKTASISSTR